MRNPTTRREFLGRTAAVGSGLLTQGLSKVTLAAQPSLDGAARVDVVPKVTDSPILVVTHAISRDFNPRATTWTYIKEILDRAGLFFDQRSPSHLPSRAGRSPAMVFLAGNLPLAAAERQVLVEWVKAGTWLLGVGGTSGLDDVFGVGSVTPLPEGWMTSTAQDHPVTAGLRSSLHVFGGYAARASSARSLAQIESANRDVKGSAILENHFGKGRAILLAPDLIFSIVHIQQGVSVLQDGKPAPDGSAPVNDGILKAEDGLVLDWRRDRQPMQPDGGQAFLEPVSDELREIILRSILHAARQQHVALPMLWYWPRLLKAIGHLSHDTDGNNPKDAVAMLEATNRLAVKSTWCTLYPGGYPRDFYGKLKEQDYEIALHYDAHTGGAQTSWSKDKFLFQHRWLMQQAELKNITTNKNHYTRWESRLDYFRWCEEAGIQSDQTRGPSKKGTIGFPLGGSQPYFPLDDEADSPRLLSVLEVNFLTQDLVVTCPPEYGKQLVDSALRHHGVAHLLFHPRHILKPGVADALGGAIAYGRARGLEWWKNEQICQWEGLRRSVEAKFNGNNVVTLHAGKPLHEATLLVLKARPEPQSIHVNGRLVESTRWRLHGFEFDVVKVDVVGELSVRITS